MTALPINPTDDELAEVYASAIPSTKRAEFLRLLQGPRTSQGSFRALFQAGVEAERARAAAETTEEWGTQRIDERMPPSSAPSERVARAIVEGPHITPRVLVRRLVGPWEVQS